MSAAFLGIAREPVYSPGKVDADRAILEAVAARLGDPPRVRVVSADEPLPEVRSPTLVFVMCQSPAAVATLQGWESAGVRVINSTAAIANTQRHRMLAAFDRHHVAHPPGTLVRTDAPLLPDWTDAGGVWIKRGDVHATEPDDVVRVDHRAAALVALAAMRRRGIERALVQRHAAGDVFKFYAVRRRFFTCFPPTTTTRPLTPVEHTAMRELADAGAAALELEVFGGDCIRGADGRLWLIDLNEWPSFARCRNEAAAAIADYLMEAAGAGARSKPA